MHSDKREGGKVGRKAGRHAGEEGTKESRKEYHLLSYSPCMQALIILLTRYSTLNQVIVQPIMPFCVTIRGQ